MIIVINGPCGVGKTEVSYEVMGHFDKAIMLDSDYIGAVHPFEIYDENRIEYLYRTIEHLVAFHKDNGYNNFVVNGVFESPESLASLKAKLNKHENSISCFRLLATESEMKLRIDARNRDEKEWEQKRFKELDAIMSKASSQGDIGTPIDTTGKTIQQVADEIYKANSPAP